MSAASCSASVRTVTTTLTRTVAVPTPSPADTATANATPLTVGDPPALPLGTTYRVGSSSAIGVLRYRANVARSAPEPSAHGRWDAAFVRMCVTRSTVVGWSTWAVVDTHAEQYVPSTVTFDSFPQPLFPVSQWPIVAHRCAEGWIVFDVAALSRVATVQFSRPTDDGNGYQLALWRL